MYYNGGLAMINIVVVASTDICSNRENEVHNEVQRRERCNWELFYRQGHWDGEDGNNVRGKATQWLETSIKRLSNPKQYKRQFLLEIRILGKYRHRNIVPLLGFCVEGNERFLVYQFISNGRLSRWFL